MPRTLALAAVLVLPAVGLTQESYWVANRTSSDVMEVDQIGRVLQTIPMGVALRAAHVAPDGKVWVVRFGSSSVDVLNSDGTPFTVVTHPFGNASWLAFDAAGHAWVSGTSGVSEFDPVGTPRQQIALAAGAPLGITVDADGNKWIAHRVGPPGSVSRIDGTTGTVTNHQLASGSLILPTRVLADRRGIGNSSHIWVVGDNRGAGELVELDATGAVLNTFVLNSGGTFGTLACDVDPLTFSVQHVYVGDSSTGDIWEHDVATGLATSQSFPPDTVGLAIDGFQNLWQTSRGTAAVLRRIDKGTPFVEVETAIGTGSQRALSTGWHHATVVDPSGDLDGDSAPNFTEVQQGSSPLDPSSIPGIRAQFELAPPSVFPFAASLVGNGSFSLVIPNNPVLVGNVLFAQGVHFGGGAGSFTNVTGWAFF